MAALAGFKPGAGVNEMGLGCHTGLEPAVTTQLLFVPLKSFIPSSLIIYLHPNCFLGKMHCQPKCLKHAQAHTQGVVNT